ncbi:MAG: restriction endonuclease subunit M [Chitinophagaceae bacterium]
MEKKQNLTILKKNNKYAAKKATASTEAVEDKLIPQPGKIGKKYKEQIMAAEEEITSIPAGKIKCFITDKLRPDTPEEHIRQRMARSLVEEYEYSKEDIAIEWRLKIGSQTKRIDIVVFEKETNHLTENIRIIVEAKKETIKPTNKENGIDQLKSYLAASLNSRYGLWVGSEIKAYEKIEKNGKIDFNDCLDIPFADGKFLVATSFTDLIPATDVLKEVFKRCHNYIATNQGGSKEAAFHEFLKVIFCKVFDEKDSATPKFYITSDEQKTLKGNKQVETRLQSLFHEVCEEYGYIFGADEQVNLSPPVIAYIVTELQKYSLLETDFDYKGQAYEEIVGTNSRGDRGEFFTPRNLCKLAIDIIIEIIGTEGIKKLRVIDPSCGTGGFLKSYVHLLNKIIFEQELKKWGNIEKAKNKAKDILKTICDRNIFGIDFNPVLVRAAQMNLVMHGDGSSNIFHENTLKSNGEWGDDARAHAKDGSFDLVISNPPFGEDLSVDDAHLLHQYELSKFETSGRRTVMAPQELFFERSYKLLKPGGYYAVVTPDNIVSNPSYLFMRHWILLRFQIIASVSLPTEMFQPSTGTQTTLLILKKRAVRINTLNDLNQFKHEPVFLSIPHKIGHDQRGNIIPERDEAGNIILKTITKKRMVRNPDGEWKEEIIELQEPIPYDLLPKVYEDFKKWYKEHQSQL